MTGRFWIAVRVSAALAAGLSACSRAPHTPVPSALPGASVEVAPPVVETGRELPSRSSSSSPSSPRAAPPEPECDDPGEPLLFVSPSRPVRGQKVRVVAVTSRPVEAALSLSPAGADGGAPFATGERHGGPPYFWLVEAVVPTDGKWRATLAKSDACGEGTLASKDLAVGPPASWVPDPPRTALWVTRRIWSEAFENLYSAWIAHLFEAPLDAQPSWDTLHDVLRDRTRNFLFDHLGIAEDELGIGIKPDCADLPYFLRAYFAFKLGLPFGWSRCSRGENGVAPTCTDFATNEDPFPPVDAKPAVVPPWADPDRPRTGAWENAAKRFGEFLRTTLADAVQSGAGRTAAADEESDYYPLRLSVETLRPGTIFADPYGHVLVVAGRAPQTATAAGVLFAVDGQPDGTVARKRFWRGNFLFAIDPALGSAGFKRFRPVFRDPASGHLRRAKNAELADGSTTDQYDGGAEGFYDKVEDVLSPAPLDPTQALLETIQAFEEQVKTRINSVDNGRKFLASGKGTAEMPDREKIFETTGSWEDFSTPSRDLRLLIAIDVARGQPAQVARRPDRFAVPKGKTIIEVRAELEARLGRELQERKVTYVRTDGSNWELSLREVADRQTAFEMAYNPNDCVERRWGAPEGSLEASTCHENAPDAQVEKMRGYRAWFHERRRPPR